MSKYLIAMVFLLGLTQNKSEALDLDGMAIIKEVVEISNKYKTCSAKLADGELCSGYSYVPNQCQNYCNTHDQLCCYKDVSKGGCDPCGDGTCNNGGEVCSCPSDCGPACGNGTCDCGETVGGCPEDCR